jgi:PAS domain S-box-containing protein
MQREIITPIAMLSEATERVRSMADYTLQVPVSGGDEVAQLGQGFNAMIEAVRQRDLEMRQLTAFQRTILKNAAYGIISTDAKGVITSFNPAAEQLLGYTATEVVGKQTPVLWHDQEEVEQRARELSEEFGEMINPDFEVFTARASRDLPDENEWTFLRKDGGHVPVLLSVTALRDDNGELSGYVGLVNDLTERKRAEEALSASESELRALIGAMTDVAFVGNAEGRYLKVVNTRPTSLLYLPPEELEGKTLYEIFPKDKAEFFHNHMLQALETKKSVNFEYSLMIGDNIHWFYATISPMGNDQVLTVSRDITDRKLAEQALQKSEALLSASQHLAKVGGWEFDIKSGKSFWTGELYRIHDLPNDPNIDHLAESLKCYKPEDRKVILDAFHTACDKGEPYDLEFPFTTFKGRHLWVRTTANPVVEDGKVIRLIGNIIDITARKQAEEALRSKHDQLSSIYATSPVGIVMVDRDGNIVDANPQAEKLLGLEKEELLQRQYNTPAWRTTSIDGTPFPDEQQPFTRVKTTGQLVKDVQHAIQWPDGRRVLLSINAAPIWDKAGRFNGMIASIEDITEKKRAEEELLRFKDNLEEEVQQRTGELVLARDAAEAANRAKSVFLANMSHELRTPLNAILGFSSIMRNDPLLPESEQQNVDIINRSGEHLLALINDVLEMAKIESGRLQLENAPLDLGAMIRDITDMMALRAQSKGLQLLLDQASHFPRYIVGDEARLRQILINLLGNAVKFTQQGGVTLRLRAMKNKISHLQIEVEDTGIGMASGDQKRIFEPFVQLGEQGISKGTGLGLTITRQFVQMMGGSINLESTPGKGTLFRIELPLKEAKESDICKPEQIDKGEVVGLAPGQPEYRILIVEDQRDNQLLLSRLMRAVGFQVKLAVNGEQGVQLFQSWYPHFIWMDRRMPVMDGMEATRRIRELPGGKEVKIAAVTASAFAEERNEMLDAGMDDYVRKPYRTSEVYNCLSKHLGVKYIYQGADETQEQEVNLTPEMLTGLPKALCNELVNALESLEKERIEEAIRKVATHDKTLQKKLNQLVENFDYPAILRALQKEQ